MARNLNQEKGVRNEKQAEVGSRVSGRQTGRPLLHPLLGRRR